MINNATITHLSGVLPRSEIEGILRLAAKVDSLESRWGRKLDQAYKRVTSEILESLEDHGRITKVTEDEVEEILSDLFVGHSMETMIESFKSARRMPTIPKSRLASYPKGGKPPKSLAEIRKLWDLWRKKGEVPKRQQKIVERVKGDYIKKCQDVWQRHSEDYRKGTNADKAYIIEKVTEAAKTQNSRGQNIVDTETTRYWNQTRRSFYDEAEDVTHYLFVPIRDMATTAWCNSRRGLIYKKGDPLLDKETPPIHWRCRSEILPLSIHNPHHLKLIKNTSLHRRNHRCKSLPPNWNS